MRIPQEVIDAINQGAGITQLAERYGVKVDHSGMAVCPFHADKTPSLSLSDDKGLYYCHACGAKGNAIQLVMHFEGLEFREAAEKLAKEAGVAIPGNGGGLRQAQPDTNREKTYFLRKLQENLKTFQACQFSICIATYQEDKPDPSSKEQAWRNNFYPNFGKLGTPAEGLSTKTINYFRKRSLENRKMVSTGVSLFGALAAKTKYPNGKYVNKSRSEDNATHLCFVGLDFDNVEWKAHKGDKEFNIPDKREAFLTETKKRLWESMKSRLEALGLWEYAAVTDTGSGYHCVFVLDRITPYADIDALNEPGVFSPGQAFEWTMKSLTTATGADAAPIKKTSLFKIILGTQYWKEPYPREVVVKKDARGFLTFAALSAKLRREPFDAVSKRYQIYQHAYKLFGGLGREPDKAFLEALDRYYQTEPNGDDVRVDFDNYVAGGELPGIVQEDGKFYAGRVDWENRDGSAIRITKSYAMKYRVKKLKRDASDEDETDGESKERFVEEWYTIPCGWALIPRYRIEEDDDSESFKIVLECLRPDESRTVTIDGRKFGSTDSLQKALRAQQVDITLNNKSSAAMFSYCMTWAKKIENADVGVNWEEEGVTVRNSNHDENVTLREPQGDAKKNKATLVGWDFVYRDGKLTVGDGEVLSVSAVRDAADAAPHRDADTAIRRRGWEMRMSNRYRKRYARPSVRPSTASSSTPLGSRATLTGTGQDDAGRPLDALAGKIDKIFQKREVGQFYLSFLAMAMAREPILDRLPGVPFLSLHGESGCGKSTLLEIAANIFNQQLLTAKPTVSTTYLTQKYRKNGVLLFDELDEHHIPYLMPFMKDSVSNNAYRPRQDKDGKVVGDNHIRNTPIVATNLPLHYQGAAWDNRMAKIAFNKKMRRVDVDGLADLRHFAESHGFELYLDLFERVRGIDFDQLYEDVLYWEKVVAESMKKDVRLAEYYAIVIAVGRKIGILPANLDPMMDFISENEADRGSDADLLVSNILECVQELTAENGKPDGWMPHYGDLYPGDGATFPQMFPLKLSRLNEFLMRKNVFRNIDQRLLNDLTYSLSFVKKKSNTHTLLIHGQIETENGIYLYVDFGAEEFKDRLWQGIQCVTEDKSKREVKTWCKVRE